MWMSRILAGARSLMIVKRQGGCHFQKWLCLSYTSDLVTRSSESNLLVSIPLPRPSISSSLGLSLCPSNTSAPTPYTPLQMVASASPHGSIFFRFIIIVPILYSCILCIRQFRLIAFIIVSGLSFSLHLRHVPLLISCQLCPISWMETSEAPRAVLPLCLRSV